MWIVSESGKGAYIMNWSAAITITLHKTMINIYTYYRIAKDQNYYKATN